MAKRIIRFTLTINGGAVAGARDFSYDDESEWNKDRGDDEAVGTAVRMSTGGYSVRFELLASDAACTSGYKSAMVVTSKEITVSGGAETPANKTYTFADGYLNVGVNAPTENPGRIPVTGWFKTLS